MSNFETTKKDLDILFELSLNARATITQIAKKVKLSKQVVSYRLSLLEKNKVILGYYAITNIYMLGKTHYRVFVKYQNMSSETEEEFMNYLIKNPKIVWIAYFDGDWDAAFLVWADNVREFEGIFDEINEKFGIYFQQKYFSIATKIEYLKFKFLNNNINTSSIIFGNCYSNHKLDKLDSNLVNELNLNGRATLVSLANKYNSSAKVIKERIDKLQRNRIIVGYNIKLNHNLLGYTHRKVLLKLSNTSKEKIDQLSTYLKNHKNFIYLVKPIGDYDYEFELMTKSNEEFHEIIKDIRSKFAEEIKSYNTVIHYKEPKSGQSYNF
ncbi:Lrp/AsnC family transcriptional regulator [Candidatus Woesearchaeota archaeon]|nr:Lrp/AsnC family transcriptional regulator [Candidatus Woesearchaeota archaeon]